MEVTLGMFSMEYTGSWILTKGEPFKLSKTIREMVEEYVYLAAADKKSAIRLISLPSRDVEETSLYFDLPEPLDDKSIVSFNKVYIII
jgi:hypothetical protein